MLLTSHKILKTSSYILVIYEYNNCLYTSILYPNSGITPIVSPMFTLEIEAVNHSLMKLFSVNNIPYLEKVA
jgi:hypothetical protein